MLKHQVILPPKQANSQSEILECCEPVIIIGANGVGKSRFGFWIEQNQSNPEKVHRISAQKSLDFPEYVQLKGLEQAEKELLFGTTNDPQSFGGVVPLRTYHRWPSSQRSNLSVTVGLDDYEKVLTLLFAKKSERDSQLAKDVRQMEQEGKNERPKLPNSPDETLLSIWKDLFPHRQLIIENGKINALIPGNNVYHGREMSDGERVALYLMAQCLCVPSDSIVIIDEPEMHLHKSLMSKLWSKIEEARPNCLFVYITHDIDFAASRVDAKKLWLKSYDGDHWNWDEVPKDEALPEAVLLEILGSRKKILFVEGEKGSLDYKVYEAVYPEFLVIPRGSCDKVVEATKAIVRLKPTLHIEAFGIVDTDYRPQKQIDAWREYNIFLLKVAEIENMLCAPEILEMVARYRNLDSSVICQEVADFVINELDKDLENQVAKRCASEIQYELNSFNAEESKDKTSLVKTLDNLVTSIDVNKIHEKNWDLYKEVISSKDYKKALLIYKNKDLPNNIVRFFKLPSGGYRKLIINWLSSEHKNALVSALKEYTPPIPI
jgi:hypothetical protein